MGGENQRSSLTLDTGYSETAQCIGKPSYLEPISGSLQKPVEGLLSLLKKIEDRSAIEEKHNQNHVEKQKRTYLERISNTMQKPIEGLSRSVLPRLYEEGGGLKPRATEHSKTPSKQPPKTAHRTHSNTQQPRRPKLQNATNVAFQKS